MALDEIKITRAITERFMAKFLDSLDLEVAIVGGGVSGLVAAWRLAQKGQSGIILLYTKIRRRSDRWAPLGFPTGSFIMNTYIARYIYGI